MVDAGAAVSRLAVFLGVVNRNNHKSSGFEAHTKSMSVNCRNAPLLEYSTGRVQSWAVASWDLMLTAFDCEYAKSRDQDAATDFKESRFFRWWSRN
jgi:hypothetical protein